VWCEYVLVHETSSLTLMVAGICKEILTVLAAIAVFGEHLGAVNGLGLAVTVLGVALFNLYKYSKVRAGEIAAAKVGTAALGAAGCRPGLPQRPSRRCSCTPTISSAAGALVSGILRSRVLVLQVGNIRGGRKLESDEADEPLLLRGAGPSGGGGRQQGAGQQGHSGSPKQQGHHQHAPRSSTSFEPLMPLASPFVVRR
jgi:hypothetical protein